MSLDPELLRAKDRMDAASDEERPVDPFAFYLELGEEPAASR